MRGARDAVRARRGRLGAAADRPAARARGRSPRSAAADRLGARRRRSPAPRPSTPEGVRFSESHVAAHLGSPTVLIDITGGAAGAAEGIAAAADLLGCDLVVYVDVGGDVIASGSEPGLGSPLCDALMLAAGDRGSTAGIDGAAGAARRRLRRRADDRRGARSGRRARRAEAPGSAARASAPAHADEIERAASGDRDRGEPAGRPLRARRARRGRDPRRPPHRAARAGRRAGPCTSTSRAAAAELPLAAAVTGSERLEDARESLNALGVSTELDYERDRSAGSES